MNTILPYEVIHVLGEMLLSTLCSKYIYVLGVKVASFHVCKAALLRKCLFALRIAFVLLVLAPMQKVSLRFQICSVFMTFFTVFERLCCYFASAIVVVAPPCIEHGHGKFYPNNDLEIFCIAKQPNGKCVEMCLHISNGRKTIDSIFQLFYLYATIFVLIFLPTKRKQMRCCKFYYLNERRKKERFVPSFFRCNVTLFIGVMLPIRSSAIFVIIESNYRFISQAHARALPLSLYHHSHTLSHEPKIGFFLQIIFAITRANALIHFIPPAFDRCLFCCAKHMFIFMFIIHLK